MDVEMTESYHKGTPQSSVVPEEPSAMTQSLYLCSSSSQSSMRSMLSMASRIRRNAVASAITTSSHWSSNSMTMSISGSFGFGRSTGMDSAALLAHGMDIMEVEEEPIFEQDLVDLSSPSHKMPLDFYALTEQLLHNQYQLKP